jgi:hypothetical protein
VHTKFTELPSSSSSPYLLPPIHGREKRGRGGGYAGGGRGWAVRGRVRLHGARPPLPGRGAGARLAPPAIAAGEGEKGRHGRENRGGRGATAEEGEGGVREALHGRENEETEKP